MYSKHLECLSVDFFLIFALVMQTNFRLGGTWAHNLLKIASDPEEQQT